MFELGSLGEFFIILIAALVLIGPKELPHLLRMLGRWSQKLNNLSSSLRQNLEGYIQEGKLEEYQKSLNKEIMNQNLTSSTKEKLARKKINSSSGKREHSYYNE
jgi:sec-independent protein translocase protein TatB